VPARSAPALWQASINPAVVILETPSSPTIEAWPGLAVWPDIHAALTLEDGLHCVLGDAGGPHHVWLREGVAGRPPACIVPRDDTAPLRHLAAWRLDCRLDGRASPRGCATLAPTPFQRQRLTLLLAILDRLASASAAPGMRGIAGELVYPRHDLPQGPAWKGSNERRRTRRLVDEAIALRDGGYVQLLRASGEFQRSRTRGDVPLLHAVGAGEGDKSEAQTIAPPPAAGLHQCSPVQPAFLSGQRAQQGEPSCPLPCL
jgi:hypothetical protein